MVRLLIDTLVLFLAFTAIPFIIATILLAGYSVIMFILGLFIKVKEFFNAKAEN